MSRPTRSAATAWTWTAPRGSRRTCAGACCRPWRSWTAPRAPARVAASSSPRSPGASSTPTSCAHHPRVLREPFKPAFAALPWRDDPDAFEAWRTGRTGYPVVDAAMRQLRATGFVHNRARMIAASFLTKDLLLDWRLGEAEFMRHLVDGDVASNNGGWQWTAGTGTDPQPWFRVFNPVLQGQRFDPDGAYVRRWVPELARHRGRGDPRTLDAGRGRAGSGRRPDRDGLPCADRGPRRGPGARAGGLRRHEAGRLERLRSGRRRLRRRARRRLGRRLGRGLGRRLRRRARAWACGRRLGVAPAVGLGVGFGVGLGVALTTPQVVDDEAVFVGPEPADGIVSKPSGRTPGRREQAGRPSARIALEVRLLDGAALVVGAACTQRAADDDAETCPERSTLLATSIQSAMNDGLDVGA